MLELAGREYRVWYCWLGECMYIPLVMFVGGTATLLVSGQALCKDNGVRPGPPSWYGDVRVLLRVRA